jgi:hypothetical protein
VTSQGRTLLALHKLQPRLAQYRPPMSQTISYPADRVVKLYVDNLGSTRSGYYTVPFEAKERGPMVSVY